MGFILPAALAGGSLLGSILSSLGGEKIDPRFEDLINSLTDRASQGISPEAEQAFLQRGRRGIGGLVTSARESLNRNLARQGLGNSSVGFSLSKNLLKQGISGENQLNEQLTLMDEAAKSRALSQLLAALSGKEQAERGKGFLDIQNRPDFGTPLGLSILALLKKTGSLGG